MEAVKVAKVTREWPDHDEDVDADLMIGGTRERSPSLPAPADWGADPRTLTYGLYCIVTSCFASYSKFLEPDGFR